MLTKQAGVLLIDQVPLVRNQITSVLASEGVTKVTGLSDPVEALELLNTKPCHLIFADMRLKPYDGIELLRKIRTHSIPRVRNIIFVMLTADATRASVEAAMEAGADDYILKPLTANQIQTRISSLLMKVSADQ